MAMVDVLLKAENFFTQVSVYLNVIVIALVILLGGFIIGKVVEGIVRMLLARVHYDEYLTRVFGARRNYARATRRTIVRLIYVVATLLALNQLSLVKPVLTITLALATIVIVMSLVLTGIDIVPNVTARADLRRKAIVVGDEISYADETGVVQGTIVDMTLTDVRVKRKNGDIFFVPNAAFLNRAVTKKHRHHA